jgi:hypothetical protein
MKLEAVKNYGSSIRYIKKPSIEMQFAAVRNDRYAIYYIKNPTEEVIYEAFINNEDLTFNANCLFKQRKSFLERLMNIKVMKDIL